MNQKQALMLTAAVLAGLAVSCGKKTASDQSLTTDIQAKLYNDPVTKPASINVAVKDGTVTLSGNIASSDIELEAMKIANGTGGVKGVNDQLKVDAAAAASQPANTSTDSAAQPSAPPPSAPAEAPAPTPAAQVAEAAPPPAEPAPEAAPPPPATPPPPRVVEITIPSGTSFTIRMIDSIDSKTNGAGQTFRATLNSPLERNGRTVIGSGAPVTILLTNASQAGHFKGKSELEVRVASISYHGRSYRVDSTANTEEGKSRGKQTGIRTGIGAAAGALIGGIAGGGKGAGIGALAGGGAGAGVQLFTHGQQVKIPSETVLTFQLEAPLTVERTLR